MNRPEMDIPQISRRDLFSEVCAKVMREYNPKFRSRVAGNSVPVHECETHCRVHDLVDQLAGAKPGLSEKDLYRLFAAADDIAGAATLMAVQTTYAQHVHVDGRPLEHRNFKQPPKGLTVSGISPGSRVIICELGSYEMAYLRK